MEHVLALLIGLALFAGFFAVVIGIIWVCLMLRDKYREKHPKKVRYGRSLADRISEWAIGGLCILVLVGYSYALGADILGLR